MDLDYRISGCKTTSQSPVNHKGINPKEEAGEGAAEELLNQLAAFSQAMNNEHFPPTSCCIHRVGADPPVVPFLVSFLAKLSAATL